MKRGLLLTGIVLGIMLVSQTVQADYAYVGWIEGEGYQPLAKVASKPESHRGWTNYAGNYKQGHAETKWKGKKHYSRVQIKTTIWPHYVRVDTGRVWVKDKTSAHVSKSVMRNTTDTYWGS